MFLLLHEQLLMMNERKVSKIDIFRNNVQDSGANFHKRSR